MTVTASPTASAPSWCVGACGMLVHSRQIGRTTSSNTVLIKNMTKLALLTLAAFCANAAVATDSAGSEYMQKNAKRAEVITTDSG
jgi:hypothetical protein